jgi:hypothetical protein
MESLLRVSSLFFVIFSNEKTAARLKNPAAAFLMLIYFFISRPEKEL